MNRVALITGVGPGLGAALARRFAQQGFRIGLIARKPEFIESWLTKFRRQGHLHSA